MDGRTVFDYAKQKGNQEIIDLLTKNSKETKEIIETLESAKKMFECQKQQK